MRLLKSLWQNIGCEGQYHVRIINQDIKTKDDATSQNNTSEPLNVQTGQEGKVADTDVAENSSTATNPKDASDKADMIEPSLTWLKMLIIILIKMCNMMLIIYPICRIIITSIS